jgi:hypothetical protein
MTEPGRHLDSGQRHTLEHVARHPLAMNVKWHNVLSLFEAMGEVTVESQNRYRVTIDGRSEVFHAPHSEDIPTEMMVRIRSFVRPPEPGA